MELSKSDLRRIADFTRKVAKASSVELVISEAFETLKEIADITQMRIVYSPAPSRWNEWRAGRTSLEVRPHEEWPSPEKKVETVFFDRENDKAGFISADKKSRTTPALQLVGPSVWSGLLLQSALTRVQKAAISETELVRETLRVRDEERRHIARELHDDLGQEMASLKLALKWAEDQARRNPDMDDLAKELATAREATGAMLGKLRDLSHTLYPRILDTLGLPSAVKELAHQVSQHSPLNVECISRGKERPLTKEACVALYRCCQEAISNAIRHSGASRLTIHIRFAEREVRISVEDDGKGFDPRTLYDSNARMMSSGFWTIRQRMTDLGGAFRVSTAVGHGTVVEMMVSYSSGKAHARGKNKTVNRG